MSYFKLVNRITNSIYGDGGYHPYLKSKSDFKKCIHLEFIFFFSNDWMYFS